MRGFTLVEVLIVIIIVCILIAALLPRIQDNPNREEQLKQYQIQECRSVGCDCWE